MNLEQWGLYLARLDPIEGSEQAGRRPVLVVARQSILRSLAVATVVPLTSRKPGRRIYGTEVLLPQGTAGLSVDSIAMAHQVRTLAVSRFDALIGILEDVALRAAIRAALRTWQDLD